MIWLAPLAKTWLVNLQKGELQIIPAARLAGHALKGGINLDHRINAGILDIADKRRVMKKMHCQRNDNTNGEIPPEMRNFTPKRLCPVEQ